ncbi:hypothetical protein B0H19DRAFT_1246198 [Mycena capillaripes]|nr:hypothetical protein B0H19DRAFT_1246198 [Mycena capillaripes]
MLGDACESTLRPKKIQTNQIIGLARLREQCNEPMQYGVHDLHGGTMPNDMTYTTVPFDTGSDEPVSECFFHPGSKEMLMNLPGFPEPLVQPTTTTFRLHAAPGKGMGLFSKCALKAGDLILSERPLLVAAPKVLVPWNLSDTTIVDWDQHIANEMEKHYQVSVSRMRPDARAAYMALANTGEHASTPNFGIALYQAVCKDISRLNHSCSSNTTYRFDMLSFSYRLFAVRDIAEDEELTLQYTYVDCSAAERRENLDRYAFLCTCASCTDAIASDPRRAAIFAFRSSVAKWVCDHTLADDWLLVKCREALALIVLEGMESTPQYFQGTQAMMEACICLGDAKGASEWAAKLDHIRWEDTCMNVKALLEPRKPCVRRTSLVAQAL